MEESYETFEEELGPQRADPPPQKPVRQIRRPEMYSTRKVREEMASVPLQIRAETKTSPREPTVPKTTSLHKTYTVQNVSQTETPWENVTLNRCLFVAITILVLTSGFQKLQETLRGRGMAEEEEEDIGLMARSSGSLRRSAYLPEPETSLFDVMFWWLPDLDDDEDDDDEEEEEEDDDGEERKEESKKPKGLRGLRNKPLPDKTLMKQRAEKSQERRAKKSADEEIIKDKKRMKKEEIPEAGDNENHSEGNEEKESKKINKMEGKKPKKHRDSASSL